MLRFESSGEKFMQCKEPVMRDRTAGILIGLIVVFAYMLLCGIEWGMQ